MERKIYTGSIDLSALEIGDSVVNCDMSQWNCMSDVPQLVADTWASLYEGAYISTKSKVGESPMKEWEKGLGIIVSIETDFLQQGERLIMLRKSQANGFSLFRSVNTRPIK